VDPAPTAWTSEERRVIFWGGVAMLLVAGLFVLLIVLALALGTTLQPLEPGDTLTGSDLGRIAQNATAARANFLVGILSDVVLVPAVVGVFDSLRRTDRAVAVGACAFLLVYVAIDLVVSGPSYLNLVSVSQNYVAGSPAVQISDLAAATSLKDLVDVSIPLSSLFLSVGILAASALPRRGAYGPAVRWTGWAAGIVGLAYGLTVLSPRFAPFLGLAAILEAAWFALLGWNLIRRAGTGVPAASA
jgi:hypothetical protein